MTAVAKIVDMALTAVKGFFLKDLLWMLSENKRERF